MSRSDTCRPGLAVQRLTVQAAPTPEAQANARSNDGVRSAAARQPSEAADSATLGPELGSQWLTAGLRTAQRAELARDLPGVALNSATVPRDHLEIAPNGATVLRDPGMRLAPNGAIVPRNTVKVPPLTAARKISAGEESVATGPKGLLKRTSLKGGRGPGTSAVPTERPGKLHCPQEPPARKEPPPSAEEGAPPGRARRAVGRDGGRGGNWGPRLDVTTGAATNRAYPSWDPQEGRQRRSSTEHCSHPLLPLSAPPPSVSSPPRPPAGGSTQHTSPRPIDGAGKGLTPADGEQPSEARVRGERANGSPVSPAQRLHELAAENADYLAANGWRDLVEDR